MARPHPQYLTTLASTAITQGAGTHEVSQPVNVIRSLIPTKLPTALVVVANNWINMVSLTGGRHATICADWSGIQSGSAISRGHIFELKAPRISWRRAIFLAVFVIPIPISIRRYRTIIGIAARSYSHGVASGFVLPGLRLMAR